MKDAYDHRAIEEKWSRRWAEQGTHTVDLDSVAKPYYNLMMFPYPSAEGLHIGNVFAFVGSDVQGRFRKLKYRSRLNNGLEFGLRGHRQFLGIE